MADSTSDSLESHGPLDSFQSSRVGTPSVPPGFGLPHAHPPLALTDPLPKLPSRIVPTSAPFTPSRNLSSMFNPRANPSPSIINSTPLSFQRPVVSKAAKTTNQAKSDVQSLATSSGLSKAIAAQSSSQTVLHPGDFPELKSDKGKQTLSANTSKPGLLTIIPSTSVPKPGSKQTAIQPSKPVSKISEKQVDLISPSTSKLTAKQSETTSSQVKPDIVSAAFPPLPPASAAPNNQATLPRVIPKTLRLVPTPKAEGPPTSSATPSSTTSVFPPMALPVCQASVVSASKIDRPGTPTSENISDNASIPSASVSRASSPPPSKIGSAPVRVTTKSMQKKQRREAQKEKERTELEAVVTKVEPEVEVAPIMGRKKKQKKERVASTTGSSTPVATRPPSPTAADVNEEKADTHAIDQPSIAKEPSKDLSQDKDEEAKIKNLDKEEVITEAPTQPEIPVEAKESPSEKPIPTPASLFQELVSSGALPDPSLLAFFKPPVNRSIVDGMTSPRQPNQKLTVTSDDVAVLASGMPVHKIIDNTHRIMFTPNGDCVRNLTPEEEAQYLYYQSEIASNTGPTSFSSAHHNSTAGFTLIGGRAVPNGPPHYYPTSENFYTTAPDPFSKLNRDQALDYINQYVLPSLSSNPQIERALNANVSQPGTTNSNSQDAAGRQDGDWAGWSMQSQPVPRSVAESAMEAMYENWGIEEGRGGPVRDGGASGTGGGDSGMGTVPLLSVEEAESALAASRKDTEALEKRLTSLVKKNKRLVLGTAH